MISPRSRTDDWIQSVRGRGSRELTEKMILAFTLVEMLQESGLRFVFKGGTSLSLITGILKRFSIDIDIICSPEQNLEPFFQYVIQQGVFSHFKADQRKNDLPGIFHFKFYYSSLYPSNLEKNHYILLDVLFEEILYAKIIPVELKSPIFEIQGDITKLMCPSVESLCGDKLTAFAPHTTGKAFFRDLELEIIKQMHDVADLFDHLSLIEDFSKSYDAIAGAELRYRNLNSKSVKDVAKDSFNTAIMIGLRGKTGKESDLKEFGEVRNGIIKLDSYIFEGKSNQETAILNASKTAYLSALLLNRKVRISRFSPEAVDQVKKWAFNDPILSQLNPLKKTNLEAFYYYYQALEIMGQTGL